MILSKRILKDPIMTTITGTQVKCYVNFLDKNGDADSVDVWVDRAGLTWGVIIDAFTAQYGDDYMAITSMTVPEGTQIAA
jgi:hypothetical protein